MTPTRGKRNSKVPERFSSEDLRIETSNSNGITILDYNDKTTSTTHRLAPIGTKIKLKPAMREPLKVKLPKLKRPASIDSHQSQAKSRSKVVAANIDDDSNSGMTDESDQTPQKMNKIKLPLLSKVRLSSIESKVSPKIKLDKPKRPVESNRESVKHQDIDKSRTEVNEPKDHNSSFNLDDSMTSNSNSESLNGSGMQIIVGHRSVASTQNLLESGNDSGIRCPCGINADLGVMVECEKCSTWQHGHCINVGPEEDAYEGYVCAFCSLPQGKHGESLFKLTVGDRFQSKFDELDKSLSEQARHNHVERLNNENQVKFSIDELNSAALDIKRVANSLDVKWKLFQNREYPAELKIWANPVWSEIHEENLRQQQLTTTCFFGDISRGNLELNIRCMARKMTKRINLIKSQLAIYQANESQSSGVDSEKLHGIADCLDTIGKLVDQVEGPLH